MIRFFWTISVVICWVSCDFRPASADVVTFEVTGRVVELDDPDGDFSTIQIGDPIEGFFRYDTSTINESFEQNLGVYFHVPPITSVGFTVGGIDFTADPQIEPFMVVFDDYADEVDGSLFDAVALFQDALPPTGFTGSFGEVSVVFEDQSTNALNSVQPPTQFAENAWTFREISFEADSANGVEPFDVWLLADIDSVTPVRPVPQINGAGQSLVETFDSMGVSAGAVLPTGWSAQWRGAKHNIIDGFGLVDGPLDGFEFDARGIVNVGGNSDRFHSTDPASRLATWNADLDDSLLYDEGDVLADAAPDRALGINRLHEETSASLRYEVEIADAPLRAFVLEWDLEIWGGDPETGFRRPDGGGFEVTTTVGDTQYDARLETLYPGEFFDTAYDQAPEERRDPTLIDGNLHSRRDLTTGVIEVSVADGAVGNMIDVVFDADFSFDDGGWTSAVDNVRLRALAPGDANGDGDINVSDLLLMLGGRKFSTGELGVDWQEGDFDQDGDFDTSDLLAMLQAIQGEFPKTYATEASPLQDDHADVIFAKAEYFDRMPDSNTAAMRADDSLAELSNTLAVPEPATWGLLAFGSIGLCWFSRRKATGRLKVTTQSAVGR